MKTKILLSFLFLTFVITGICGYNYVMRKRAKER